MKKVVKKIALLLLVFGIGVGVTLLYMNNKYKVYEEEEPKQIKKHVDTISMMLETEAGSGNYEMTTASSWPTDGYIFNTELSKCENGGELSWDDENKRVLMSGNVSDKCYVYFDIYVPPTVVSDVCNGGETLSTCITTLSQNSTSSYTNIYHHDSALANGAGDNSYRYAGANPNNFVCFGTNTTPCPTDNLYRIIGVFGNQVKLIKYDYATSALLGTDGDYKGTGTPNSSYYKGSLTTVNKYYWNNSTKKNTWSESELNKTNLNTNFITNIGTEWAQKIAMTTWKVGGNTWANIGTQPAKTAYQNEIVSPVTTNTTDGATECSAKIGLMYASDYGFAAAPSAWTSNMDSYDSSSITSVNWMYMGLYEWTISRNADNSSNAFFVLRTGYVGSGDISSYSGCRPSFNLLSSTTYVSGSGSASDPMVIN